MAELLVKDADAASHTLLPSALFVVFWSVYTSTLFPPSRAVLVYRTCSEAGQVSSIFISCGKISLVTETSPVVITCRLPRQALAGQQGHSNGQRGSMAVDQIGAVGGHLGTSVLR